MSKEKATKYPIGLVVFFAIIFTSSLLQMNTLASQKDWYWHNYPHLPAWLTLARYSFSWLQRILGILTAFGVLFRVELFRKIALLLGAFTILTIPWKHSKIFITNAMILADQKMQVFKELVGVGDISLEASVPEIRVLLYALDILFWLFWIYYFTRPKIKNCFQ